MKAMLLSRKAPKESLLPEVMTGETSLLLENAVIMPNENVSVHLNASYQTLVGDEGGDLPLYLAAAKTGEGNPFFKADPGLVLWTWIIFGVTLLTLYRFAWKPILKALDDREKRIRDSLDAAKTAEEAAAASGQESEKILADAHHKGEELIEEARRTAAVIRSKMEVDTQASLKAMTDKADASMRVQQEEARRELQKYSVHISLKIAGKLIEKNLSDDENENLAKKFLNDFK